MLRHSIRQNIANRVAKYRENKDTTDTMGNKMKATRSDFDSGNARIAIRLDSRSQSLHFRPAPPPNLETCIPFDAIECMKT